ncbi:unnamed protein product [Albugo candida]|uniref:Uncharacterized protein n=1 Tax=Albugo candida TaxID=65357 RepID=A0A024GGY4_9STRA|nr:unnamed protein product [Albugo candida]|eukprot:CCI46019.1 unnamed protein product [Albugo candida]
MGFHSMIFSFCSTCKLVDLNKVVKETSLRMFGNEIQKVEASRSNAQYSLFLSYRGNTSVKFTKYRMLVVILSSSTHKTTQSTQDDYLVRLPARNPFHSL